MTDKDKAAAREYSDTVETCCGTSDILIAAENAFLAGVTREREQSKVLIEALKAISLDRVLSANVCNGLRLSVPAEIAREALSKYRSNKPY